MATLTYTQIYSMTQDEIHDVISTNMENGDHEDTISIGEKMNAIEQVKAQRSLLYPSIQEQLDMQYWDKVNGTNTWQETIDAIKTKYPKE